MHLIIPSEYSAAQRAQAQVVDAAARSGYSEQSLFAIRLALEEALCNAIKHGNKCDPAKKVTLDAQIDPRRVRISVEDEGGGFDRASVPDPTDDKNLAKINGRGILLIESYMNRVQWTRGGRRVIMVRENA